MPIEIPISNRKKKLLLRLVDEYIRSAKPISSLELAPHFRVSSATIRNELKELEELGFLRQPHQASGRVPTARAYRLYVDQLLSSVKVDTGAVRALVRTFRQLGNEIEKLVTGSLDELMQASGYMAYVMLPRVNPFVVRSINFIEIDNNQLIIVMVTDLGVLQSEPIRTEVQVKKLMLGHLNERLTNCLRGRNLADLQFSEIRSVLEDFATLPVSIQARLETFLSEIASSESRVVFSDAYKLLTQPEFYTVERFRRLIDIINDEDEFLEMLEERASNEAEVDAIIGEESGKAELSDISILFSQVKYGGGFQGKIGLLGPARLDYSGSLPLVLRVAQAMSRVIDEWREGSENDAD